MNFENNRLVTVGTDGVVAIFQTVDKEPRRVSKDAKDI